MARDPVLHRSRTRRAGMDRVVDAGSPDAIYESVRKHFSKKEIVDLSILVGMINLWNRLAISARIVPGTYQASKPPLLERSGIAVITKGPRSSILGAKHP